MKEVIISYVVIYVISATISLSASKKAEECGVGYLQKQFEILSFIPIANTLIACARLEGLIAKFMKSKGKR